MSNIFDSIKIRKPQSSAFDLSHERKMSCKMGTLNPIFFQEVVPGDKFSVNSEIFMRMAPMVAPVMHRVNVFTHFFFVPNRLIWNEWQDFITGGPDGTLFPVLPTVEVNNDNISTFAKGTLADYLGVPDMSGEIQPGDTLKISALPFRAYQLIYNEYYRDQNLTSKIDFAVTSGACSALDQAKITPMRKRAWEKDYFTSALPWAQRGPEVSVPVEWEYLNQTTVKNSDGTAPSASALATTSAGGLTVNSEASRIENLANDIDLSINALRAAVKLQEWLEKNARGGARYIEQILVHFGVKSSDARLQRPEYLGGGKQPVVISEVLNNSATATEPQGNMSGHGISVGKSNSFSRSFEEHGIIIGIMSVLPRTAYQQGLDKYWRKTSKLEFYWPEFANLGEQPVGTWELYCNPNEADSILGTFGYQSRYAEYKYKQSSVHGDFKDDFEFWHMGRIFTGLPALNTSFIEANPTDRIFAVQDGSDQLYVQIYNNVRAVRPIPYHGIPSLL